jgi:hypothetical protein
MPVINPTAGMMMTVLTALNRAQEALRFQNAFIRRIFWDYQPVVAVPYATLNVNIPTVITSNVTNIGAGPLQPQPYAFTTVPITLDTNMSNSYIVYDWDQTRIAYNLQFFFFQPKLEELMRAINQQIVAQFTPALFNAYPIFTGTGTAPGQMTRADITTAWKNLAQAGVPVDDVDNVSLIVQTGTYGAMLSDQQFIYQYIVGDRSAEEVQQRAQLRTQYGADVFYDQQLAPFTTGAGNACALFHRYAVAGVTALPPRGGPQVLESTEEVFGLPTRIQIAYDMLNQGWMVHMHVLFGLKTVRPEMGSLFQTATAA